MDFNLDQTVRHLLEPEIPVDALAGRQEHVLENAEGTAHDGNQPFKRDVALLRRPYCSRGFSTRTWTGWKRLSRAPASRDQCRKTNSECKVGGNSGLAFFFPDGLKIERVEGQIPGGRRNKCPDFHA